MTLIPISQELIDDACLTTPVEYVMENGRLAARAWQPPAVEYCDCPHCEGH